MISKIDQIYEVIQRVGEKIFIRKEIGKAIQLAIPSRKITVAH